MKRDAGAFVLVDGDDVGEKIDALIVRGDVGGLKGFTREIDQAVARVAAIAREADGEVHMAGGDNVLARVPDADAFVEAVARARESFCCTFSIGVGATARESQAALKAAKETAPGAIVRSGRTDGKTQFRRRSVKGTWVALA